MNTGPRVRLRKRLRRRSDDGQFLAMTAVFMTMFLALAGLVADGGHYLDAKQAAASEAEQAARAGAGSLNISELHAGTIDVDPASAVTAAENYMTVAGQPGTAWVLGNTVYAQISYRMPTQLLGIIGVGSLALSVTESATDVSGITTGGRP
jgi:Flp pilus assembly protein TadG